MPHRLFVAALPVALALLLPQFGLAQQKEKVYRKVTPQQVEDVLKALDIDFKRGNTDNVPNSHWYDYERDNIKVRLGWYDNGRTLWVSANFPKATLETINNWNVQAKFSRAVLVTNPTAEFSMVESQLDVAGGATERNLRQFLLRFDEEAQRFDKFLAK